MQKYCLLLIFGLLIPVTVVGQSAGQPLQLFDGKTLTGWNKADGKPHDGWVVDQGALFRKSGGGDLYHAGTFRDFILYFEWKISAEGNSGVKYRVRNYEGGGRLGCEYQILDDQGHKEENKTGCLYGIYEASSSKPVATPGVWHTSKIVVCGNHIEHWLDGIRVIVAEVGSAEWQQRVADSKFNERKNFAENREGRIFLQDHGGPVWFRQIVLVPIDCNPEPVHASWSREAVATSGSNASGPDCSCGALMSATLCPSGPTIEFQAWPPPRVCRPAARRPFLLRRRR